MNSREPMIENEFEYRKIIDNLKFSNEQLKKEVQRLKSLQGIRSRYPLSDINVVSTNNFNGENLLKHDFTLIINHIDKVIYIDKNGLKLWNVTSPEMIPTISFTSKPQNMSHSRTKSSKLVLPDNKVIARKRYSFDHAFIPRKIVFHTL